MAKPKKLTSIVRSYMRNHHSPWGLTGWLYPNQRVLMVKADKSIRNTYDAYYRIEIPEDVQLAVTPFHKDGGSIDREHNIDVTSIGRVIISDMNVFGLNGVNRIEMIGRNVMREDGRMEHRVEVGLKNGLLFTLDSHKNPSKSWDGDVVIQGTEYWSPDERYQPYPHGGSGDIPIEFGGYGIPSYEYATWG